MGTACSQNAAFLTLRQVVHIYPPGFKTFNN